MLNYVVDPGLITPLVPPETEIDFQNGETFLSVVGFLFLDTRLLGLEIPLHRDFEEVNLRFYVRRKSAGTWRRGVVFIRELVPRRAIAFVARTLYGENYIAVPMKHEIQHLNESLNVEYSWRRDRKWESLKMTATGEAQTIPPGSHAEFYNRTLLRLHRLAGRMQRISRGTSALEDLECYRLRIQRQRGNPLRRAVHSSLKSTTTLRVHWRWFANYGPKTRVVILGRLFRRQRTAIASTIVAAAQTVKSRRADNNRFRSAYRSGALLATRVSRRSFFRSQASPVVLL